MINLNLDLITPDSTLPNIDNKNVQWCVIISCVLCVFYFIDSYTLLLTFLFVSNHTTPITPCATSENCPIDVTLLQNPNFTLDMTWCLCQNGLMCQIKQNCFHVKTHFSSVSPYKTHTQAILFLISFSIYLVCHFLSITTCPCWNVVNLGFDLMHNLHQQQKYGNFMHGILCIYVPSLLFETIPNQLRTFDL